MSRAPEWELRRIAGALEEIRDLLRPIAAAAEARVTVVNYAAPAAETVPCSACGGSGYLASGTERCGVCRGSGMAVKA